MIEGFSDDGDAIPIRAVAVLPRPVRKLPATAVRRSATLLGLSAALTTAPLTLARRSASARGRLLRETGNSGKRDVKATRQDDGQRTRGKRRQCVHKVASINLAIE